MLRFTFSPGLFQVARLEKVRQAARKGTCHGAKNGFAIQALSEFFGEPVRCDDDLFGG